MPQAAFRRALKRLNADAILVTNCVNIRYLTGFNVSVGLMIITTDRMMLFLDDRYFGLAKATMPPSIELFPAHAVRGSFQELKRIAVESDSMKVSEFESLKRKYKNKKFVQSLNLIEEMRRKKTLSEQRTIRRAIAITTDVLAHVPTFLKKGITERELAWKISMLAHDRGADDMAFPTIVGFGDHTAIPHHHPTDRALKPGDIVQIDCGAKVDDYCSDMSRVFFTGIKTAKQRRAEKALRSAIAAAKAILRPGVTNHALDRAARAQLKKFGFDKEFSHALGHGVGLEIHDGIVLSARAPKTTLLHGDVVTLEPGLYFPGEFGMRIEDTYIVS